MAFCKKCGAEIDDQAVICPKCGVHTLSKVRSFAGDPACNSRQWWIFVGNAWMLYPIGWIDSVFSLEGYKAQDK